MGDGDSEAAASVHEIETAIPVVRYIDISSATTDGNST
jgi:hypothetical protein